MKKVRDELKIFYFIGMVIVLLATIFLPMGLSDYVLPELGGGVIHQTPDMSENIWLPIPTENVGELWYSHSTSSEWVGCQGNGIVGNSRVAANSFNGPWDNLILYDFYGNKIWSSGPWLGPWASASSPMIDINDRVVACDQQKIIFVNATNHDNPYVEWDSSKPDGIPISPAIVENKTLIIPTSQGPLLAYDVETGDKLAEIKLGNHTVIDPYFGIPKMNWAHYITVMYDYIRYSICPYRYNSTTDLIEWNSSIPYGIMPKKEKHFYDGNPLEGNPIIHYYAYENNVTASQFNGIGNWTVIKSNNIESGGIYTGEGYFSTINSATVDGNQIYLVTEYTKQGTWPFIDDIVNNTVGRLYAVNVTRDDTNGTVDLDEYWNYTYFGRSQASPTLINDTLYFDGYNNTILTKNRDTHIYAVYTNGTEKWKRNYSGITWFTFTKDPRGGFWYEDCDQVFRPRNNTGGNKLVRFYEENGTIWEEIDMKTLLNSTGEPGDEPVLPSSDMTIGGTPTNPIMLISANHIRFDPGKWVLAINLTDNNSVIWKVPIESEHNRNYAHGDYTILTKNNVSRIVFPTNVGGVKAIGTYPDCWFENLSYELWDKPNDGDSYNDSVNVSFSIKSCLPYDLAMVKATLISVDHPVLQRKMEKVNYDVNTTGTDGKITVTLPNWFSDGEYDLKVYLYNSSGVFNRGLFNIFENLDNGIFANETHEYGPFNLYPSNSKPDPPHTPSGETEVYNWDLYPYTTNTTDIDNDYLYYKWQWDTILGPIYSTWDILNPYQSGENCTREIGWIGTGSRDISVKAKDHWLSIDPTDWSTPLTVTVSQSDNSNGCPWSNPLLNSFSANAVAVNEQTSSTGFNSEVYIEQGARSEFTWFWDFGDGNTSDDEEVSHNYSQVGNYTVNLTLTYQGDEYNVSTVIEVLPLKARYDTSSDGAQPDVNIIFNDTSQGLYDITNYTWDLGDGNVSYEQNVSHSFSSEGVYNVSLTVMDQNENINTHYQIIRVETTSPTIIYVDELPHTVGFGSDINIYADFYDNESQINSVSVNITYPDNSYGNFTMSNNLSCPYDFEYVFNDTWQAGLYNYSIWVYDHAGNSNATGLFNFSVSVNATISVCTIKDTYGDNESLDITDPPNNPTDNPIGYELMDDDSVLRIWNNHDSYYFDTNSGIQLTNHYDDYWSHNVLMLGYYNNDQWNLIYRTDELSGFSKIIDTDDETYVEATLWKDLSYGGYDFRLALQYHLELNDTELTITPYIKNLGSAIPYTLGFGWELKDIQIDMTPENDYIEINRTSFYLNSNSGNETIDITFRNMTKPIYCWNETANESVVCGYEPLPYFYIRENKLFNATESLYLKWNESLDYIVKVKSRDNQYNAPVTLAFKIGTLAVGQEKSTELLWHDDLQQATATYYFNRYDHGETWLSNPSNMVDGSTSNYASTTYSSDVELCDGNTCSGTNLGTISKVELRAYGYYYRWQWDIILRPVFDGRTDGDDHTFVPSSEADWSEWFDITEDNNAPEEWTWTDVDNLDCDVESEYGFGLPITLYCSKVEVRVTYTPNHKPSINNPYPSNGSSDVSLTPELRVTVDDADDNTLTAYWYSNSSGSWVLFATNTSIDTSSGSVTIRQTNSNFTSFYTTYYWSVRVNDGIDWTNKTYYFTTESSATSVDEISPYIQISSPLTINASGSSDLDNVTLWYRYSSDNSTWEGSTWWDLNWSKRKQIDLNVSSGSTSSGYQVKLNVTYDSDMNNDFSDLRFVNHSDDTVVLDYWVESQSDGSWCIVWVEISDVITTTNQPLAWMYYGNSGAESASDGFDTFLFFDDFSGSSLNSTRWPTQSGSISVSGGEVHLDFPGTSYAYASSGSQGYNGVLEFKAKYTYDSTIARFGRFIRTHYGGTYAGRGIHVWDGGANILNSNDPGVYHKYKIVKSFSNAFWYFDDVYKFTRIISGNIGTLTLGNSGESGRQGDAWFDYIFIREYVSSEPSYSIGDDQVSGWMIWNNAGNPDTGSPWSWSFNCPNGTGYYEFYSIGKKSGYADESAPGSADARCVFRNQSKIVNTGSTNFSGYLLIQVQYNNSGDWIVEDDTINETTPRTINVGGQLALDLIFNGEVSTDDFTHGDGTYRIYAAFRDPDGDVLVCDDETALDVWYEFEVDTS